MKLIKIISILSLTITSLSAEVRFDLRFVDDPGKGFHAEGNAWMKKAVTEAADCLGKTIKQDAFVTIEVLAENTPTMYARAWSPFKKIESVKAKLITKTMNKILNNESPSLMETFDRLRARGSDFLAGRQQRFEGLWEGEIAFNTDHFSDFHSLKRSATHELTHSLGFLAYGAHIYAQDSDLPYFIDFDQFITDGNGNKLLISETMGNDLKPNPQFDRSAEIFACGPNIKKHNKGQCVKLYNPQVYASGASFSHLDTDTYPRNLLNHWGDKYKYDIWNKYEIGIMQDLGYEIDWENYCKAVENELKPYTLDVNMEALKGKDCYFVVKKSKSTNNDFPQECPKNNLPQECPKDEIFYKSFSSQFEDGYKLQLFYEGQLMDELLLKDLVIYKTMTVPDSFSDATYKVLLNIKHNS